MSIQLSIEVINSIKPPDCKLTAIEELPKRIRNNGIPVRQILYLCECGNTRISTPTEITKGGTKSCGCGWKNFVPKNKKYTIPFPKLKGIYYSMISRCHNPKNKQYKDYGERGVSVCLQWRENPQSFFDWAKDKYNEGLQLDKDIIGDGKLYSPETCIWVSHKQNQQNTRRSHKVLFKGELINLTELERITGVPDETIKRRMLVNNISAEEAVALPKWQRHNQKTKYNAA